MGRPSTPGRLARHIGTTNAREASPARAITAHVGGAHDSAPPPEWRRGRSHEASVSQITEQSQQFQVQPDEGDHQAERGVPSELLIRAVLDALLDDVEIEDEVERGDNDADEAEDDRERAAVAQSEATRMEQVSDQVDEHQAEDTDRGSDQDPGELGRDPDRPSLVDDE